MEKRIFLAVVISIALLALWSVAIPKFFPELAPKKAESAKPPVARTTTAPTTAERVNPDQPVPVVAPAPATVPVAASSIQNTTVDTPEFTAVFSNRGAQLVSFTLKKYKRKDQREQAVDLVRSRDVKSRTDFPFMLETRDPAMTQRWNSSLYTVTERDERGSRVIDYRYSDGRYTVTKSFRFDPNRPFLFDFSTNVQPPVAYRVAVGPGIRNIGSEEVDSASVITGNGVIEREGKFKVLPREKGDPFQEFPGIDYIGIEDNYFLTVLRPTTGDHGMLVRRSYAIPGATTKRPDFFAAVNATGGTVAGSAFFGPKETKILDAYGFGHALQLGWFGLIARFFLVALTWINTFTHNYGWAIVVLTILIKIVLYPLQHKSNVSMKKMQRVSPKIEALKAKYKKSRTDADQRNKMNMEMMQLYQKEGINPMAGCLPLVLQLPILWGFYNLLSRAIELRGAPWTLWIKDLSEKDPTYVLPILMTATMFLQTYLTPATGDPAQRKMFLIMPLVFGFMFKDFPSGLVLYWFVQNILTIIQQLILNKWWKDHPDPPAVPATT